MAMYITLPTFHMELHPLVRARRSTKSQRFEIYETSLYGCPQKIMHVLFQKSVDKFESCAYNIQHSKSDEEKSRYVQYFYRESEQVKADKGKAY